MTVSQLTDEQAGRFMAEGEAPAEVAGAAARVAVVLTQSWCPQWGYMRGFLRENAWPDAGSAGLAVFYLEYDLKPYFADFLRFKENMLGNEHVPYIRYYRDGRLVAESNFVGRESFLSNFERVRV